MYRNPVPPKNPEYVEKDDGTATHYCGRCGRKHYMGDYAKSLSPCCSYPCYPLVVGLVSA